MAASDEVRPSAALAAAHVQMPAKRGTPGVPQETPQPKPLKVVLVGQHSALRQACDELRWDVRDYTDEYDTKHRGSDRIHHKLRTEADMMIVCITPVN